LLACLVEGSAAFGLANRIQIPLGAAHIIRCTAARCVQIHERCELGRKQSQRFSHFWNELLAPSSCWKVCYPLRHCRCCVRSSAKVLTAKRKTKMKRWMIDQTCLVSLGIKTPRHQLLQFLYMAAFCWHPHMAEIHGRAHLQEHVEQTSTLCPSCQCQAMDLHDRKVVT